MSDISEFLSSARTRISTGKGIIQSRISQIASANREDGSFQQRNFEVSTRMERQDGAWETTHVELERQDWNEQTAHLELGESPEDNENWFDENSHVEANVNLYEHDFEVLTHDGAVLEGEWGSENNSLEVNAFGYETGASATLGFNSDGFNGELAVNAEVYLLSAEYQGSYGPGYLNAEVFVGAEAEAGVEVNFNPMDGTANLGVGAEAFVGGKAEAEAGIEGQYGNLGGNAGVTYGLGAEFNADVGLEDWAVSAEFDIGATLGLGVDLGFEVEFDARETVGDLAGGAQDVVTDILGWRP